MPVIVGETYGLWTVLEGGTSTRDARVACRCACGTEKMVGVKSLMRRLSTSCGYERRRLAAEQQRTHGRAKSSLYNTWCSMKQRCLNPCHTAFHNYGGRGIAIHPEWIASFEAFLRDVGERPPGLTLDRINNDGNYEPGNVRWATPGEQNNNRRGGASLSSSSSIR